MFYAKEDVHNGFFTVFGVVVRIVGGDYPFLGNYTAT